MKRQVHSTRELQWSSKGGGRLGWVLIDGDGASGGLVSPEEGLDGAGDRRLRCPLHRAITHISPRLSRGAKVSQGFAVSAYESSWVWLVRRPQADS